MTHDSLEGRLAKVEAELAIRNLVSNYAIALDTRDMDKLASLYDPELPGDPDWGPGGQGEAARISVTMKKFYRTFHTVFTQVVELTSPTTATGVVYTLAQHELGERWIEMAICYRDFYVLRGERWLFAQRRELRKLYLADMERGPTGPYDRLPQMSETDPRVTWPHAAPSWSQFWSRVSDEDRAKLTRFP
jgi:uncharacterized membrane protein